MDALARDSRYVTNTGCSGAKSLTISRFRCTTEERLHKSVFIYLTAAADRL
jgi:hypothetical protein